MGEVTCRKTGLKKLYAGLEHGVKLGFVDFFGKYSKVS